MRRRKWIKSSLGCALIPGIASRKVAQASIQNTAAFSYCLNTSTIMGQDIGLEREIEIAAEAGYDGIEIWIRSIDKFMAEGGRLSDLKQKVDDLGIGIENAIGFAQWIVDDNDVRSKALEQAKHEMGLLRQLGCRRIAAPPAGGTSRAGLDLDRVAERFRALCDLGTSMDVVPQLEIWGFSANLSKLSEVLYVAAACGHPQTRILPDVYHLYKGGSDFDGLKLLSKSAVEIFHMNDYPGEPDRATIGDQDRVYPGLGVAPIGDVLQSLVGEAPTVLSLELFNRSYWEEDALEVAKKGLKHMQESVMNMDK